MTVRFDSGSSLDRGSIDLLDTARWTRWMTVLLMSLAVSTWLGIVYGFSGGHKDTGGAVYTASGAALIIVLCGQPLVRWLGPKLGSGSRTALMILLSLVIAASVLLDMWMFSSSVGSGVARYLIWTW